MDFLEWILSVLAIFDARKFSRNISMLVPYFCLKERMGIFMAVINSCALIMTTFIGVIVDVVKICEKKISGFCDHESSCGGDERSKTSVMF